MSESKKLVWDKVEDRLYETGVDHGVIYPIIKGEYTEGVVWNGLTGVTETPSGAESTAQYADNIKYLNLTSAEDFGATIEAYTYPPEFAKCDGSAEVAPGVMIGQQARQSFGFSFRSKIGDSDSDSKGYKIHIIYGAKASTSERSYATVNDSPEALTFSWEISTTPVTVTGHSPTAIMIIDSTKTDATKLAALETILYGSDDTASRLPLPDEIIQLLGTTEAVG